MPPATRPRRNPALQVYRRLLRRFGPQGWWPTTPPSEMRPAYAPARTRGDARYSKRALSPRQKLEIIVGAILTQNTSWSNVVRAIENLNRAGAMELDRLRRIPARKLRSLVRPSGFFVQKAKKVKIFVGYAWRRHGGDLDAWLRRPLTALRQELLGIHGIGPETADSILLYAGNRPVFVVDAYTRRIGNRLGQFLTQDYHAVQLYFEGNLPKSVPLYQEYHALLVRLAKEHCRKNDPLCGKCPLLSCCAHGQDAAARRGGRT